MTAFANFLAEYRAMPPVKQALEHDPKLPISTHYAALVGMLEQIEMRDIPRAAALYEPVRRDQQMAQAMNVAASADKLAAVGEFVGGGISLI